MLSVKIICILILVQAQRGSDGVGGLGAWGGYLGARCQCPGALCVVLVCAVSVLQGDVQQFVDSTILCLCFSRTLTSPIDLSLPS